MRKFWIGTAAYLTLVGGLIAGSAAAFNTVVGLPAKGASDHVVVKMEPVQRTSGKWTPVEIKREPNTPPAPPLPPYVNPRLAAAASATGLQPEIIVAERKMAARKPMKKVIVARRA